LTCIRKQLAYFGSVNTHLILQTAATFNANNNYDLDAVLKFAEVAIRHAHMVQLARQQQADPQLVLPMDLPKEILP
jgi:hypothetical protein